jgi:hypothetical protein
MATLGILHLGLHVLLVGVTWWGIPNQLHSHVEQICDILRVDITQPDSLPKLRLFTPDNSDVTGIIYKGQIVKNVLE